jgi:deoxyhypusine synthase
LNNVKQMNIRPKMTVGQLVEEMKLCGVLGAGRLAKAVDVFTEMLSDESYTVFLSLAGPMVPGGLRNVISELIKDNHIDVIVTNGANVVHDIIEALGKKHLKGSFFADDSELRSLGRGRIGDIYVPQEAFEALEKELFNIFDGIPEEKRSRLAVLELLNEIGRHLKDEKSILYQASIKKMPIFAPGILDSMVGLHIWTYSQTKTFNIDQLTDMQQLSDIIFDSEKTGAIILGGGLPKHFVLGANILREGVDAAIQITLDRPEAGSLSGAPLEEGISWKKVKDDDKLVTVIGDAVILFPIIVAASLEKLEKDT